MLNNRMYGEYYKLYNIIIMQLTERNILLSTVINSKKYPIYKDLEQLKEYSIEEITDIHNSILEIINELYSYYSAKQTITKNYSIETNNNISISNFIHTLEYENTLIRGQLYLYISYIEFFHSTQTKYIEKLFMRINNFNKDVSENITSHSKNTSFIDNITNIKDVVISQPSSPVNSLHTNLGLMNVNENIVLQNKIVNIYDTTVENGLIASYSTTSPNMLEIAHNNGLCGIIYCDSVDNTTNITK